MPSPRDPQEYEELMDLLKEVMEADAHDAWPPYSVVETATGPIIYLNPSEYRRVK
jgi:hypothetical protein